MRAKAAGPRQRPDTGRGLKAGPGLAVRRSGRRCLDGRPGRRGLLLYRSCRCLPGRPNLSHVVSDQGGGMHTEQMWPILNKAPYWYDFALARELGYGLSSAFAVFSGCGCQESRLAALALDDWWRA